MGRAPRLLPAEHGQPGRLSMSDGQFRLMVFTGLVAGAIGVVLLMMALR
jgi:hypothetical protein